MTEYVTLKIDGRNIKAEKGIMLLSILNDNDIYVPQLCNHPSLPPNGACRLCSVEITKDDWNGNSKIVTSCLYPAEDNLVVSTRSKDVLEIRRSLLELYMARCPGSVKIKDIARLEGVDETPFTLKDGGDNCILCGLCTRVCQDCGPGAISTLSRGIDKFIGPDTAEVADSCTGCRACAHICPTDAIHSSQGNKTYEIWNRKFEIPICSVKPELCRGCGICEEVCPFNIPRVNFYKTGLSTATISETACTGCGICAGSCPTGAIEQNITHNLDQYQKMLFKSDLQNKTVVFSCPRSPMPTDDKTVIQVSCIGNVDLSMILYPLAAGAKAVGLMCRDKLSCPYMLGGNLGEEKINIARQLLSYCGVAEDRITLLNPDFGQDGPMKIWSDFLNNVKPLNPLVKDFYPADAGQLPGLDLALNIIGWLKNQPGIEPVIPPEIKAMFNQDSGQHSALLYLDNLPEIHLMLPMLTKDSLVLDFLTLACQALKQLDIKVKPVCSNKEIKNSSISKIVSFSPHPEMEKDDDKDYQTLNHLVGIEEGIESTCFSFKLEHSERKKLLEQLISNEKALFADNPNLYLQFGLLMREGSWQQTHKKDLMPKFISALKNISDKESKKRSLLRIENHPILPDMVKKELLFTFNGSQYSALEGEVITSALYAAGITVFGHHHRDNGAQGIYCVNGQCSQCMVIADGKPVKGCMTPVSEGMKVESVEGLPVLGDDSPLRDIKPLPEEFEVEVLIIGGGPAGISAAIELGTVGADVLVIDDKQELGGKLSLQTHNFFGSVSDCYAGDRGIDIGHTLSGKMLKQPTVETWFNATVVGVYSDGKFGVSQNGSYRLVNAKKILFATGAREKTLSLPGCDLPGVYGAGAFQTLVNRDLVKCAEQLFIIGGGNVGLIGAYHALQAGIDVVGLVEALPQCGGYKVHEDKIKRLGVPVMTSHTVLRIEGSEKAERVITAAVDENFVPQPGTERVFEVDTVLMAVGLSPVDELFEKAKEYGLDVYAAGDAEEIAEASAAIFSGKITGRRIAQSLGYDFPIPGNWEEFGEILKHHSTESEKFEARGIDQDVYPIIRCIQEIPCNPCTEACPKNCITMKDSILNLPEFGDECIGCANCVLACPGLAISLLIEDYDPGNKNSLMVLPYEFHIDNIPLGKEVVTAGFEGEVIGKGRVLAYKQRDIQNKRVLVLLEVPYEDRLKVAGFKIREEDQGRPLTFELPEDDPIVCRCERVRKSEIVNAIRSGVRDLNQLKAQIRTGLGGCNGKTCFDLILRIYREEGIALSELTMPTHRPLVAEVHLGDFISAGSTEYDVEAEEADNVNI